MRRPWKEGVALAAALAALAAAVYGPHAIHGGFLSDSWANRATYLFASHGGLSGALDQFLTEPNIAARPLYAVYLVALNAAFGSHMGFWFAWLGATGVLMSLSLYLLLRKLDFEFLDAGMIACLVLVFPAASSLRLWAATVQIPVAVGLAAFGFLLALVAFDARSGRRTVLHCASLGVFVASLLFYEAALPLMLFSGLLYRLRVPWLRAGPRWAVDVIVLVSVAIAVGGSSPEAKDVQDLAGMWHHATTIFDQGHTLLAMVVLPFGGDGWHLLALAGLAPLAAGLVARRLPRDDPTRARLRRWLAVLGAGLVVVLLGYSIFVPGIDYYIPMGAGIANRVNAVPSIGWVLALYALIMLSATLAFRGLAGSRVLASGLTLLACALVAVGWVQTTTRDADAYTSAFREDERVLAAIRAALPDPPPGSTIWTFGQPVEIAPGVPVFGNTWDMTASVQLMYGDPSIRSYVGFPDTTFECRPDAIVPGGNPSYPPAPSPEIGVFASSYDGTYFVDTTSGRIESIQTPEQCKHAADSFERSPAYPGE